MRPSRVHKSTAKRRGAVLITFSLFIVPICGMIALAVDIGLVAMGRIELHRTADAAALAAVMELPTQSNAQTKYGEYLSYNETITVNSNLSSLEVGWWDKATGTFTARNTAPLNAVRASLVGTQDLYFSNIFGIGSQEVRAQATAYMQRDACGPLIGDIWVDVGGDPTSKSYNSTGEYTPGDRGSVCSNGPITMHGGATVLGDANAGPGYTTDIGGSSGVITGNTDPRTTTIDLEPVDSTDAQNNNDNSSLPLDSEGKRVIQGNNPPNFKLTGGLTYDLPPGTYWFDDFEIGGQSVVNISGPTILYLEGDLHTSGGDLVNTTLNPGNFQIFMTGGRPKNERQRTEAKVQANIDFYGVIYAPTSDVTISGGGDIYGLVVGYTLDYGGNGTVYYDEALDLGFMKLPRPILVQ